MSRLETEFDGILGVSKALTEGLNGHIESLKFEWGKLLKEIEDLEMRKAEAQGELDDTLAKVKDAEQRHRQTEQSIASLKAQMNELLKKLDLRAA